MLFAVDVVSYKLRRKSWLRFASTFLLFYAQIIVTEFSLGLFSVISIYSLVAFNFLISTFLILFVRRKYGSGFIKEYFSKLKLVIKSGFKTLKDDPYWLALIIIASGFILWIIFLGIIFPVTDFDGNSYHLTYIGNLVQNHNIFDAPTSLTWLAGYPKGGELIQAWSVLIAHNDMLTDLTQIPFLILGVFSLYAIAAAVGAEKKQARFAATLFVFLPIVLNQLKTSYVDVMLCSLFFAGLAMVVQKKLKKLDFVLIGVIFSLIISVKSTGFLFVVVLLPLLFRNLYSDYGKKFKNYLLPLSLVFLPTVFGFYWYVKDYILYGSPIYPFGFKLAGLTIFPGKTFQEFAAAAVHSTSLPNGCVQRIWFVWTEQKDWFGCLYNYDTNYAGLGPVWFIVLIPAILISIYIAVKKRNYKYLAVTATVLALFVIYPTNYYSRYTMFITATGILALSLALTYIGKVSANIVKFVSVILAISVIATNLALCNFPPLVVKAQFKSFLSGSQRGPVYSSLPGKAFVVLEDSVKPGDVVEYSASPYFIYPLWTPNFSDKVIYIEASSKSEWLNGVRAQSVDYVFTTLASKENTWAKSTIKSIYKDDLYEIFQVN